MPIPRSRRILFLRTSIIATGVTLGLILQWLWPPREDVLFDSQGTGGARPRAGRALPDPQAPFSSPGWQPISGGKSESDDSPAEASDPNA